MKRPSEKYFQTAFFALPISPSGGEVFQRLNGVALTLNILSLNPHVVGRFFRVTNSLQAIADVAS